MDDAKLEELGASPEGIVPVEKLEKIDLPTLQAYAKKKARAIAAKAKS